MIVRDEKRRAIGRINGQPERGAKPTCEGVRSHGRLLLPGWPGFSVLVTSNLVRSSQLRTRFGRARASIQLLSSLFPCAVIGFGIVALISLS